MLEIIFKYKSDTTPDYRSRHTLQNIENDDTMRDFQTAFKNFLAEYKANNKPYVTAVEIASILCVSQSAVYNWTRDGMPVHRRPAWGRGNRYLWDEIIPWLTQYHPSYVKAYENYLRRLKVKDK